MSALMELTDEDFQDTINTATMPVLIDFSATWCQPCKALAPIIESVAAEYDGKLIVRKVDIDKARNTAVNFGILGVPTCIFFKDGNEVSRFTGLRDVSEVKSLVEKVL